MTAEYVVMPLSLNEIKQRAITFSRSWCDAHRERAEAQTFWNEFFEVFGVHRRTVASFEEPVRNLKGDFEFIDLFWTGKLIVEHKSRGASLSKAHSQAMNYIRNLATEGRTEETPRYLLVSDFWRFALHDLEETPGADQTLEFTLDELHRHIRAFAFIAGYEIRRIDPEDPANIKAVEILGNLHDRLEDAGYAGHDLQRFMVRILFCLFADDTGIFEPDTFKLFIRNRTSADGSDLGTQLNFLFQVLDTPAEQRQRNLDEDLAALPYVNGDLFRESLRFPVFDSAMRTALLSCCNFHWERISPAVFGSLFQSIMTGRERRQIGAHYTSERDIIKLIRSLFLDDLRAEFESFRREKRKLEAFHRRLAQMKFLDPACGCGNFLVLGYRELRRLEMDVIEASHGEDVAEADLRSECRLDVRQFHGIEIEEWPVRIAEVALWLMDHQMNQEVFHRFGGTRPSTPLRSTPTIRLGNALRIDWNEVLPAGECAYVLGNPPFVGKKARNADQVADMELIFGSTKGAGVLDYVCCWYAKAAAYIRGTQARAAFVSTNSITQGEQAGVLWPRLFGEYNLNIHFAHRTFAWESEARGKAHVHVVIIGFGQTPAAQKRISDYETDPIHPTVVSVSNISPYLVEGPDAVLRNREEPLCSVPEMQFGSMPNDDGNLLLTEAEKLAICAADKRISRYVRPFLSAREYLHGVPRWCLWLVDARPTELAQIRELHNRVLWVKQYRERSVREVTRELAKYPSAFGEIRQPKTKYILVPRHSSENRRYIPLSYFTPHYIVGDSCLFVPKASLFHFGVLSSAMHMAWVRQICGRIKSDFRYSNKLVYNNFPWPLSPTDKQSQRVEQCAQAVLDARTKFPDATLADLYDPVTMPPALARAHADLDGAVDRCYRRESFDNDRHRFEFLFALYEKLAAPLTTLARPKRRSRK